jgi:hypothetical protein
MNPEIFRTFEPAVLIIQQISLLAGILIGVVMLATVVTLAAVIALQNTVVPVPQLPPLPYFSVGKVSAAVAPAADEPN